MTLHPPLPTSDAVSAPFWEAAKAKKLVAQKCEVCDHLQIPFRVVCQACKSDKLSVVELSGRGSVFSFTETVTGARHPYFQSISPYLVGIVQLEEDKGLLLASNFPGSTYADLKIGAPVTVEYQELTNGVVIPQFSLRDATKGER